MSDSNTRTEICNRPRELPELVPEMRCSQQIAPTDPLEYHFEGMATRTSTQILFPDSVDSGATIWLSACWVSARGQIGNGSVPISFTLQGGAIPAVA